MSLPMFCDYAASFVRWFWFVFVGLFRCGFLSAAPPPSPLVCVRGFFPRCACRVAGLGKIWTGFRMRKLIRIQKFWFSMSDGPSGDSLRTSARPGVALGAEKSGAAALNRERVLQPPPKVNRFLQLTRIACRSKALALQDASDAAGW